MNLLDFSQFPPAPVARSSQLVPLESWHEVAKEAGVTSIEFDNFWLDCVLEGVAYFFRWEGSVRATVLVIWSCKRLSYMECRSSGDRLLSAEESAPVELEVRRLFFHAGVSSEEVVQ